MKLNTSVLGIKTQQIQDCSSKWKSGWTRFVGSTRSLAKAIGTRMPANPGRPIRHFDLSEIEHRVNFIKLTRRTER
jgi:hypothetical protein